MEHINDFFALFFAAVGFVGNYMMQVPPEDAVSNVSKWIKAAGFSSPTWLEANNSDRIFKIIFRVFLAGGLLWLVLSLTVFKGSPEVAENDIRNNLAKESIQFSKEIIQFINDSNKRGYALMPSRRLTPEEWKQSTQDQINYSNEVLNEFKQKYQAKTISLISALRKENIMTSGSLEDRLLDNAVENPVNTFDFSKIATALGKAAYDYQRREGIDVNRQIP